MAKKYKNLTRNIIISASILALITMTILLLSYNPFSQSIITEPIKSAGSSLV